MAQFDVYENSSRATKKLYPYLLDIQADLLDDLKTTVVIPLGLKSITGGVSITKLCPTVDIDNKDYIVLTPQLSGVDRKILGNKVCNLAEYRSEFISAVDFVLSGI